MAENDKQNKSSKNIGDLYVDIEAKGLQALLKGLNKISSSFFIAKKTAHAATILQIFCPLWCRI